MQLSQLVANVQDVFKRPDMQAQVEARVRGAILWAHKSEYFIRDRQVAIQAVQNPSNLVRMALPPFFRQFEIIRPMTAAGDPITLTTDTDDMVGYQEIDPRQVNGVRSGGGINYYYVAGDVINISTTVLPANLYFLYYALPDLRSPEAVTWITEQYNELIEFRALSVLFSMQGNQELRNNYAMLANEQLEMLRDNAFQAGGAQ